EVDPDAGVLVLVAPRTARKAKGQGKAEPAGGNGGRDGRDLAQAQRGVAEGGGGQEPRGTARDGPQGPRQPGPREAPRGGAEGRRGPESRGPPGDRPQGRRHADARAAAA